MVGFQWFVHFLVASFTETPLNKYSVKLTPAEGAELVNGVIFVDEAAL